MGLADTLFKELIESNEQMAREMNLRPEERNTVSTPDPTPILRATADDLTVVVAAMMAATAEIERLRRDNKYFAACVRGQDKWFDDAIEGQRRDRSDAPDDKRVMARAITAIENYKTLRDKLLPDELLALARNVNEEGRG